MQWSYLESFQDSPSPYLKKQSVTNPTQQKVCTVLGEKYNPTTDTCVPCEEGTYQNTINHTLTSCKPHVEPVCDDGFYLDTATYTTRKNATKDSTVNLDGLCLEHDSLEDLREQCSDLEYITESDYEEKINTMKKSPLTSTQICKKHTSWDNIKNIGSCNEKKYFDRTEYNNSIGNKERNVSLEDICSTIPYYPLNVKNTEEKNFTTKENLNMFFRENGKYLNIRDYNGMFQALRPSDNAIKIPITWNNNTKKIQITSRGEIKTPKTIVENVKKCLLPNFCYNAKQYKIIMTSIPATFYAKVVGKQVRFVKEKNELPVTIKDDKLFVTGTNIEIVVNNCNDNQYMDQQTNTCKDKVHNCPSGQYSTNFGSSGTQNDPICLTKTCSRSKYRDPSKPYKNVPASKTTNDANCIPKINTCAAGKYRSIWGRSITESDPVCRKCSMGTYQNESGQTSCKNCPQGTYQNESGQTSCKSCPDGQFQNASGSTSCKLPSECQYVEYVALRGRQTYYTRKPDQDKILCVDRNDPLPVVSATYGEWYNIGVCSSLCGDGIQKQERMITNAGKDGIRSDRTIVRYPEPVTERNVTCSDESAKTVEYTKCLHKFNKSKNEFDWGGEIDSWKNSKGNAEECAEACMLNKDCKGFAVVNNKSSSIINSGKRCMLFNSDGNRWRRKNSFQEHKVYTYFGENVDAYRKK